MTQPFEAKALSIRGLLTDSDSLYKIPNYQRPYKWTADEVEQLWEDIKEAYDSKEKNYFLGSIITAKSDSDEYQDVIDGQQRLTTLIILCCVIRDMYPDISSAKGVTEATIKNAIFRDGEMNRIKFCTHDESQTDFENYIVKAGATEDLASPSKDDLKGDLSKHKFINSAIILRKRLEELRAESEEKLVGLVNFLFNFVNIIRINCSDVSSAIRIFQVINARGMDLTSSDLIKSFLLGRIIDFYRDYPDTTSKKKQNQFIADWNTMEENVENCGDNMENMFIVYEYYALAKNPVKGLYEELSGDFKNRKMSEIIPELKEFFSDYKNKIHDHENRITYSFWYLPWGVYWKSILLSALRCGYSDGDYQRLAKAIRRFYYLYWIGGRTVSKVKQTSFNVIREIKKRTSVEQIEKLLTDKIEYDEIIADAARRLNSNNIASERWCKPLLLLVEYDATDDSKLSYIEWDKKLHLEHVLPAQHENGGWKIDNKVADNYLQSAGNITLLSGKKNIVASNKTFHEKMDTYRGGNGQGITAFRITQKILEDYDKGTYKKQWNEDSMRDRKNWFLKEVSVILEFEINPDSD